MLTAHTAYVIIAVIASLLIVVIIAVLIQIHRQDKLDRYLYSPQEGTMNAEADDILEQEFWGTLKNAEIFS